MTPHASQLVRYGLVLVVFMVYCRAPIVAAEPVSGELTHPTYHRTQAAQYRAEAARLQGAIQRYEILIKVYSMGSDRAAGTINPQGRRLMVERTKRTIAYFTQQKGEHEQRAAEHETLAQMLPEER